MKKLLAIWIILFGISSAQNSVDHSVFTEILQKYSFNGLLDYDGLTKEKKLDFYLDKLSNVNPDDLISDSEKIAFWINVYNAFTIKVIVNNYPVESINDLHTGGRILGHIFSTTIWDDDFININEKELSLNDVEHEILRKDFKEPRIHFGIVCASISCPNIRNEAFTSERLNFQLEQEAIKFFNDDTKNKFDRNNQEAYLSKILDWFSEDFGENDEEILLYVAKFLDEDLASDIIQNVGDWSVDYLDYDWGLNEHK